MNFRYIDIRYEQIIERDRINKLTCSKEDLGWRWYYSELLGLYFRAIPEKVNEICTKNRWEQIPMDNAIALRRIDL